MDKIFDTEKRIIYALLLMMLLILNFILFSCGTARRGDPVMGKLTVKNEKVQHGEMVFMNNCEKCHPGGEAGVGPAINNLPLPGEMLKFRVRSKAFFLGLGKMPSFKKNEIPSGDLKDLVAYIKANRKISDHSCSRNNKNVTVKK